MIKDLAIAFYNVTPVPDFTDSEKWMEFCEKLAEIAIDMCGAGESSALLQINTTPEACNTTRQPEHPRFFNDIIRKLEFSAQQSELWEEPEDVSVVAIEYRALAMKLKNWMEKQS